MCATACYNTEIYMYTHTHTHTHTYMIRCRIVLPLGKGWLVVKKKKNIYICMLIYYPHKQTINFIPSPCHPLTMIQVPLMTENLHDGTLCKKIVHVIKKINKQIHIWIVVLVVYILYVQCSGCCIYISITLHECHHSVATCCNSNSNVIIMKQPAATITATCCTHVEHTTVQCNKQLPASKNLRLMKISASCYLFC